jgi:hypothetical protein
MADDTRKTPETPEEGAEREEKIDLGASLRKEHKEKKPMSRAAILIIVAVVVAVVAALAIALPRALKPQEAAPEEDLTVNLSGRDGVAVERIKVEGESVFTVTKDESAVYHVDALEDGKVNQSTCSSAFTNAAKMQADQLVEADAADLTVYGLDQPSSVVTVDYADGGSLVLELGDVLSVTGQVYCRVQGEGDVYVLRPYFANLFGGSILRYRGLELPEISAEVTECKSIIIRRKGQEQVRFMPIQDPASFATGTWKMTEPKELWLDSGAVAELVESVSAYKLYGYEGQFEDLAPFGLDDPWFTVIMSDVNGVKRTLSLGDELEGENRYYCTVDDSGEVFTISDSYLDFAEDFKESYYLDAFTNIVSITVVDKLNITDGNKSYEMTIERQEQFDEEGNLKELANGSPDYLETFRLDGKECQEDAFKAAYQAVIGVTISNMAEEKLVDETQAPVLTVSYTFNNGHEPMVIEYLPYDINNYCVRRDGNIDLICKKELVDSIMPTLSDLQAGRLDKEE